MSEHELVIRGGLVVDGTGAAPRHADVAIDGGVITAVGDAPRRTGRRARSMPTASRSRPGFVDIHTHYDGQATWDGMLAPSSIHGVTSLVMGNCGVGFAPAKPTDTQHEWLIGLLEGVEDIPGTALAEGLTWDWETFPEYMDALDRRSFVLDVATQVAHAPLRVYVMGERGADPNEAPTVAELAAMAAHVRAGIDAGALGFTTSRTYLHRTKEGAALGTRFSSADELTALAGALSDAGAGVIQLISDAYLSSDQDFAAEEMQLMRSIVASHRSPAEHDGAAARPGAGALAGDAGVGRAVRRRRTVAEDPGGVTPDRRARGAHRLGQPAGHLPELQGDRRSPAGRAGRPAARPRAPGTHRRRARRVRRPPRGSAQRARRRASRRCTRWRIRWTTSRRRPQSIAGRAAAAGVRPIEMAIDLMLERDGNQLMYMPLMNYVAGNLDDVREMLLSPVALMGLSDAGAHCGAISDGSMSTTSLALWTRDRTRGEKLPLELMVHHITQRTAAHVGWLDRGVVAPGYLADINVIDMGALAAHPPTIVRDLPAGGRRLMQTATGYRHTFKGGVETFADGEHTGVMPGGLVRGARSLSAR